MRKNNLKPKLHLNTRTRVLYNLYAAFLFLNVGCRSNTQQKKVWKRIREKAQKITLFSLPILLFGICWCVCLYVCVWWIYYYSGQKRHLAKILFACQKKVLKSTETSFFVAVESHEQNQVEETNKKPRNSRDLQKHKWVLLKDFHGFFLTKIYFASFKLIVN